MPAKKEQPIGQPIDAAELPRLVENYVTALAAVRAANDLLLQARLDLINGLRSLGVEGATIL